ncbi:ATP-binding protein [Vibrio vulnificus]|nr:ATP-binding protein [Vibrio vulnificus]HAS8554144.1 ATP-binding protein [Vibrio vulnificus]
MLIGYGLNNYFGFREGVEISFELPSIVRNEFANKDGFSYLLGVKGKNGAGKTNVLKGLSFISEFVTKSFSDEPTDTINIRPFYSSKEPTSCYIEYIKDNVTYRYELVCSQQKVLRETLFRKEKRLTKIVERTNNEFTTLISEFNEIKVIKLRDNASFISTCKHYDLLDNIALFNTYSFFNGFFTNVHMYGLYSSQPHVSDVSELYFRDKEFLAFVKNLICACDTGVHDIEIIPYNGSDGQPQYSPMFSRVVNGKIEKLTFYTESSGTKSLYLQLFKYKRILDIGGVLILDEFDINLHPHILPKLLDLFCCEETNSLGAQLIFSTHDADVMDFLGKYRTYLVDKEDNECYAYRLDEIPSDILRKGRSIVSAYNAGKIGGVPKI